MSDVRSENAGEEVREKEADVVVRSARKFAFRTAGRTTPRATPRASPSSRTTPRTSPSSRTTSRTSPSSRTTPRASPSSRTTPRASPSSRRIPAKPKKSLPTIQLLEHQVQHVRRLKEILKDNPVALDYSEAGMGKTYVSSVLSLMYGFKVVVLCPSLVGAVWKKMKREFDVPIVDVLSYPKLVGRKGSKQLNHPYLTRSGDDFHATEYLNNMIEDGVLFVFDEMAITKNKGTLARKAVHAIIKRIVETGSSSRAINISALPNDKVEQVQSMCQVMGIVLSEKYWDYDNRNKYTLQGIMELIRWCKTRDPIETIHVLQTHLTPEYYSDSVERGKRWVLDRTQLINMTKSTIPMLVVNLYTHVVRDRISNCMVYTDPELDIGPPPIRNLFCEVYGETAENRQEAADMLQEGRRILETAVNRRSIVHPGRLAVDQGEIRRGFRIIGGSMLTTVYHLIRQGMEADPMRKFVVGVWFVDHITWLLRALDDYGVRAIYGAVNEAERDANIKMFQEDNNICRILIINPTVGSMGISIDDQVGNRPRTMYVIPDNRFQHLVQFTYRVWRSKTASRENTDICVLFSNSFRKQLEILDNLLGKSDVARQIIKGSRISLPSDYRPDNLQLTVNTNVQLPPLPAMRGAAIL